MSSSRRVLVCGVMTFHNRRQKTLEALECFFGQEGDFSLHCVLMDDGSSDGTSEAVRERFPSVIILEGNGDLFWNRGMAAAFLKAKESEPDFFLWLNDDTNLSRDSLSLLFDVSRRAGNSTSLAVVAGSTRDPRTSEVSYGGMHRTSRWHPGKFSLLSPTSDFQNCDTMNGNIVLIPRRAAELIGDIDERFSHAMGDLDYGLRARGLGIPLVVAPGFQGECEQNSHKGAWRSAPNMRERLKQVNQPKGLPMTEWAHFLRKHGGVLWPLAWLCTYRRVVWQVKIFPSGHRDNER